MYTFLRSQHGFRMKKDNRDKRHLEIASAAYEVLAQRGYAGASLLNIAKAAKASNETLYRWYGSKQGLFEVLVQDNAADVKARLEGAVETSSDPLETLKVIGPLLLEMLLGEKAILLNRAAASDPTRELGLAISNNGREVVAPLITKVFDQAPLVDPWTGALAMEFYLSNLIGDLQIRRAIGALAEPDKAFIQHRADRAIKLLSRCLG